MNDAVPTASMKERLQSLEQYMPDRSEIVYGFGKFLADQMHTELVPLGFVVTAESALYSMKLGEDFLTGKPVPGNLHGHPDRVYELLDSLVPDIAAAACPPEFAYDVRRCYEKKTRKLRRK